jgi:hypothetical protein
MNQSRRFFRGRRRRSTPTQTQRTDRPSEPGNFHQVGVKNIAEEEPIEIIRRLLDAYVQGNTASFNALVLDDCR